MTREMLSEEAEKRWFDENQCSCEYLLRTCSICGKRENRIFYAPENLDIEVWEWDTECYNCKKNTPVIWTVGAKKEEYSYSIDPYMFKNLTQELAEKYPFFKKIFKKTQKVVEFGNTCVHCGAYQGDWYLRDECLEISYWPEAIKEKTILKIKLTDDERFLHAGSKTVERLMNHTLNKETGEKILTCNECWRELKKTIKKQ